MSDKTKTEILKIMDDFSIRDADELDRFMGTDRRGIEGHIAFVSGRVNDAVSVIFIILRWLVETHED